jgi:hyperosmotically inducible periplasmic protein
MKKNMYLQVSVFALLISFLSLSIQSCKGKNRDSEINTAIQAKTQTDPTFAGINASVSEGTVTLTGQTADAAAKANVEKSVKEIDGVKKVVNSITVAPVTVTQDDPLNAGVQRIVSRYGGVQGDVSAGTITLRGQLARDSLQSLMMELNELKPRKIENQLVLK